MVMSDSWTGAAWHDLLSGFFLFAETDIFRGGLGLGNKNDPA